MGYFPAATQVVFVVSVISTACWTGESFTAVPSTKFMLQQRHVGKESNAFRRVKTSIFSSDITSSSSSIVEIIEDENHV